MKLYRHNTGYPPDSWAPIEPSDNAPVGECRQLYIGGAGDLVLLGENDVVTTFVGVPAGTYMTCSPSKIMAATTATNIVRVW